jgi:hypothetical protein
MVAVLSDMISWMRGRWKIEASNATRFWSKRNDRFCVGWEVNFIGKDKVYKDEGREFRKAV